MPGPPVVLVHGLGASARSTWREAGWLDLLADAGRSTIAPDLPGHGATPLPDGPVDLAAFVLDLLPDEPVDAIGFSLGSRTLLMAASTAPERFHRLVITGLGANVLRDGDLSTVADAIDAGDEGNPIARYFLEHGERSGTTPAVIARLMRESRPPVPPERLALITAPTLVVIGERDMAGPGDPLAEAMPDGRCITLPGVDHFATPKQFGCIDAALEFLGAVP